MFVLGFSGEDSWVGSCLLMLINSCLRCMVSIIFGFNLPMLCMFKYYLISVISCCICFIKYLILVWCIMNSECNSKNLLAVNSVCLSVFMFNIVSFMHNMVSMIMSIFSLFSYISPLEMLVIATISSKIWVWSICFSYNYFTSAFQIKS